MTENSAAVAEEQRGAGDGHRSGAQQVEGDDRIGGAALAHDQGAGEDDGRGDEAEDLRRAPRVARPAPDAGQHQRGGRAGQQHGARHVERTVRARPLRRRQAQVQGGKRGDADRQVDEEDPAPAGMVDQDTPEERADDGRQRERRRDVALVAAALARGHEVAHRGHRHRHQPAGGSALYGTQDDELRDVLRRPAQRRGGDEDEQRHLEQQLAPVAVAELAPHRRRCRRRHHVGGDDPGDVAEPAEVGGDDRQRGGQDRLVEDRGQHREDDRREGHGDGRNAGSLAGARGRAVVVLQCGLAHDAS